MHLNKSKYIYFVPKKYQELVDTLVDFFASREPGTVISPPQNGMPQRIEQLIQDYQTAFDRPVFSINLGPGCEDMEKVGEILARNGVGLGVLPIYLLVNNSDYCFKSKNMGVINGLLDLQYGSDKVRTVFFFESNIFLPEHFTLLNQTHLFAQVYYFPLYDLEDAEKFVYYSAQEWLMSKPPAKVVKKIVDLCAGQMWLLRHSLREYRENKNFELDNLYSSSGIQFRLEQIASAFTKGEIVVLRGESHIDHPNLDYLTRINMIDNQRCSVPLLYKYLLAKKQKSTLEVFGEEIICNGISLKHSFTKQEYSVLKLLISCQKRVVKRDEIASLIWGREVEQKYSLWAIEQLIRRIRKKLGEIGLNQHSIKTIRNAGYKLENE